VELGAGEGIMGVSDELRLTYVAARWGGRDQVDRYGSMDESRPVYPHPSGSPGVGRWAWPALLALVGVGVSWALWAWYRFPAIGGADPGMWEAAAQTVARGEPSPVAPVFPVLVAAVVKVSGLGWDRAGMVIAVLCFAALGPATFLLARRLGAPVALSVLGGLVVSLEPWLALGSLQCQPDTLSALVFVLAMLAGLAWLDAPRWPRLLLLLAIIGILPQVREHAPPVAAGLMVLLVASPGRWSQRLGRLGLAVLAVLLVPMLLGEPPGLPWEQHWVQLRWGEVVRHFFETGSPSFLSGTPRGYREAFAQAYAEGSRLRIAWLHASLSFHSGWSPWLWLFPGLAGWLLLGRRRWLLLAGLLPLLAVPGGAQQPRHVAVLVPLAVVCWVAALVRFGKPERWVLGGFTLALAMLCCINLPRAARDHQLRCELRGRIMEFSDELCLRTAPEAISAGGNQRPLVYCERRQLGLAEAEQQPGPLFWVGALPEQRREDWPRLQASGWTPLQMKSELYPVFQRTGD